MRVSELLKNIKKYGHCEFVRHGAEHDIWKNRDTGIEFSIPRHKRKEIKTGTANSILKDAGLK